MRLPAFAAVVAALTLLSAPGAARDVAILDVDIELVPAPYADRVAGVTVIVRDGRFAEVGVGRRTDYVLPTQASTSSRAYLQINVRYGNSTR